MNVVNAERERVIQNVFNWYVRGEDGIMEHWIKNELDGILPDAFKIWEEETAARLANEAYAADIKLADEHRLRHISTKYVALWRERVHRRIVGRKRQSARRATQEGAMAAKRKKLAASQNLVDDFMAATKSSRKKKRDEQEDRQEREERQDREGSLDSLLNAPHLEVATIEKPTRTQRPKQSGTFRRHSDRISRASLSNGTIANGNRSARHSSTHSTDLSNGSLNRSRLDNPLNRSLADYPEAFTGASRLSLTKDYASDRPQISGVQTDYFRLKALGIQAIPGGFAKTSTLENLLRKKRSHEDMSKEDTWNTNDVYNHVRSRSSSRFDYDEVPVINGVGPGVTVSAEEAERIKANARAIMAADRKQKEEESRGTKRSSIEVEDDPIIARSKRVRAAHDDYSDWMRKYFGADAVERCSETGSYGSTSR
jgi:hypothetical protein